MQFGDAVTAMRNGLKVCRAAWDTERAIERGSYLKIEERDDPTVTSGKREAIVRYPGVGAEVGSTWASTGRDLLADDWELRQ